MARLAIFIDGGYFDHLAEHEFQRRVDFRRLTEEIVALVASRTPEPVDLLRVYYYNCLPYQSNPPTQEEAQRYAQKRQFFEALKRLDRFTVREGRLARRGTDASGKPIFEQKRTDLLLGLDFALLSGKRQITHAAIVAGDSDLLPAFSAAKQEGISVWLVHGPRSSSHSGESTYAQELWMEADMRFEITTEFMKRVERSRPARP